MKIIHFVITVRKQIIHDTSVGGGYMLITTNGSCKKQKDIEVKVTMNQQ